MEYQEFLKQKEFKQIKAGFDIDESEINPNTFEFQRAGVKWAVKRGKAAFFWDTGLGKTRGQLAWAEIICKHTGVNVLILAPLAVSKQTQREGLKMDIAVTVCRSQDDVKPGINITNYEMLQHFDLTKFVGLVLDESSIIKNFTSSTANNLIQISADMPYKLACTATPSPNDFMELGTHAEFLNIMSRSEMLATFFVHDMSDTQSWRLKGHAEGKFFEWLATWAMLIDKPSSLGFEDKGYDLPPLNIEHIILKSEPDECCLVPTIAQTLTERREARRESLTERVLTAAELAQTKDMCLLWCDYNNESEMLKKAISGAVEVKGSDKPEHKEKSALDFADGNINCLISKASIMGFGMNFQVCHDMIFVGLSDSYERFYQAIRRCWRFGQTQPVNVYVVISEKELATLENIKRKERDHDRLKLEMVKHMSEILKSEIFQTVRMTTEYNPEEKIIVPEWLK